MDHPLWQQILLSPGNEDLVWELFHENSKIGQYSRPLSDEDIRARMEELHETLPYEGYPIVPLPVSVSPLKMGLAEAITARVSCREMAPSPLSLPDVAALLHYAYGVTRDKTQTHALRSFRVVPSGGGLFPLEIFFHSTHIVGLEPGLYHYNPVEHHLRHLKCADCTSDIAGGTVYPKLAEGASLIIFITALFERSVFKYRDRGYRFVMLEAGHVAQNLNLVATALGLGCINIGGFFDRAVDDLLGLDGVTHSTLYLVAVGSKADQVGLNGRSGGVA
jgi:SagB-type dehydrogenase family enzyme